MEMSITASKTTSLADFSVTQYSDVFQGDHHCEPENNTNTINVVVSDAKRRKKKTTTIRNRNQENLVSVITESSAHTPSTNFSYINIGSIKNKTFGLYDYIDRNDFDILVLTETWLFKEEQKNLFYLREMLPPAYKISHTPRSYGQDGYGGVAIVYKDSFTLRTVNSSNAETNEFDQFEFMDCKLNLNKKTVFRIFVVYRPGPTAKNNLKVKLFWKDWINFLSDVVLCHNNWIIVGDLNFHLDDPSKYHTRRFVKILDEFGLIQHIKAPTHVAQHTLDVLITPNECSAILLPSIAVHDPCISDNNGNLAGNRHYAITWTSKHKPERKKAKEIKFQNFKKIDCDEIRSDFESLNLAEMLSQDLNVNELLSLFEHNITRVVTKHAPITRKKLPNRPPSPWYNEELRQMKAEVRIAERRYRKSKLMVDHQCYEQICNKYNKLLCKTRNAYEEKEILAAQFDRRKLFTVTKSIMGSDNRRALPKSDDDKALAESFSNFFHEKIRAISEELDALAIKESQSPVPSTSKLHLLSEIRQVPKLTDYGVTTPEEVTKIVLKSNDKYCAVDLMPTWLLKYNIDIFAPSIARVINKSLTSGEVPKPFKFALVSPGVKRFDMDSEEHSSYRPVSNLPVLAKITEKIVYSRLEHHLATNTLLAKHQSAYRTSYSTETLLLRMSNDILISLDKGQATLLVTLDISAAFDTVNHKMLLDRYRDYFGIDGLALKWLASYLTERQQAVKIGSEQSTSKPLECGFAQGSVLGGPKYNMFSSPIEELIDLHQLDSKSYADDTNLYQSFIIKNGITLPVSQIEACLDDVSRWMIRNRLKLNTDKTEVILFLPKSQMKVFPLETLKIRVGSDIICPSIKMKSLGVTFDSTMTMEQHISSVTRSAWYQLRRITRVRSKITRTVAETLVNSLVTTKLDYCNSVLAQLPAKTVKKFQRLQNAAAKTICKLRKYDHVTPSLKQLHWLPVNVRSTFKVLILTYKSLNGKAPDYLAELLNNEWNLRSSTAITLRTVSNPRTNYGKRAFSHLAPYLWNQLPADIRSSETLIIFKKRLKTHFFNLSYS